MLEFIDAAPYAFFFLAAALLTGLIAWRRGTLLGWTLEQRVALFAAVLIGANIGSRWLPVEGYIPQDGDKTVVGGLVGAGIALAFALRALSMNLTALDAAIPAVPVGMAIGRIGCFLAGCCFGTPTTLAWGATYAPGSIPFKAMVAAGLLDPAASATPALHPTQLYETGFDLTVAALVVAFRRHLRAPASAPLLYVTLYSLGRFAVEFVRFEGTPVGGLKPLQWGLLAVFPIALAVLIVRERRARGLHVMSRRVSIAIAPTGFNRFALGILVAAIVSVPFASPVERICFQAAALLVLFAIAQRHHSTYRVFAPIGAMALLFQGGGAQAGAPPADSTFPRRWWSVGAATNSGGFQSVASRRYETYVDDICGTGEHSYPVDTYRDHSVAVGGVTAQWRREETPDDGVGFRGGVVVGQDRAEPRMYEPRTGTTTYDKGATTQIVGARAVADFDSRVIGFSIGAVGGQLPVLRDNVSSKLGADANGMAPVVGLKLKLPWLHGIRYEYALNDQDPGPLFLREEGRSASTRSSFSYRFTDLGTTARVGWENYSGSFYGVRIVTREGWEIEPQYVNNDKYSRFSLAVKRRFALGR